MDEILIIGSSGSTGKRYSKIVRDYGHIVIPYDGNMIGNPIPDCDRAIIASPTATHIGYALTLQSRGVDYLCEKPACDDPRHLYMMTGKMVNNWAFVFPDKILSPGVNTIHYRNSKTGNEGYWYDTCQLHILSNGTGSIIKSSNGFSTTINGEVVTLDMIEDSYRKMIGSWLHGDGNVWDIKLIAPYLHHILLRAMCSIL